MELFFDLFFVACLSTFTATHEILNLEALGTYIGFLGIIWFTWIQVTFFDTRFARDTIFKRVCKAIHLATMVGFASAGTRLTIRVRDENVWAFQSLSLILGGSRLLLSIQYTVNAYFLRTRMKPAARGVLIIAVVLFISSVVYFAMYSAFGGRSVLRSRIWVIWGVLFEVEMLTTMAVSSFTAGIGFQETHLNVRMGLLTLIIIGEGVIAVTRIVNKTVRPGGWTKWSFGHILAVTLNVYFLWQAYYDLSPRGMLGSFSQQLWAQLHYPFHVVLVLLLEGSQILALTLDITLKLTWLAETIMFACEDPRPPVQAAIDLLRSTVQDMEINYSHGAIQQETAIAWILEDLPNHPLCPADGPSGYTVTSELLSDLVGNVTAALFSSMGIGPSEGLDINQMTSSELLRMYIHVLGFVYVYFFVVASLAMFFFAAFVPLAHRHSYKLYMSIKIGTRVMLGVFLACLIFFIQNFALAYAFMTSPAILYAFTLTILIVLLVDRLLDHYGARHEARIRRTQGSEISMVPASCETVVAPPSYGVSLDR